MSSSLFFLVRKLCIIINVPPCEKSLFKLHQACYESLVNTSTTCSSVLTYWSFIPPFCTHIHYVKYRISMCFDLSWNTGFFVIFIQLWLSHRITVVSNSRLNNPDISFRSHMASQLAEKATIYSASAVLRATLDYFLLNHEFIANPRL